MTDERNTAAVEFLQTLVGMPLQYGLKSPDMDLYDFGFGTYMEYTTQRGEVHDVCTHTLHVTCRFKVVDRRTAPCRVKRYYEDSSCEEFHAHVEELTGAVVKRVGLSDKNDLWLDLGDFWLVFATFESGEESWRFFRYDVDESVPHLVASDQWLDFS